MRMKLLSEKWQNISVTGEKEKLEKKSVLEQKLRSLEERISAERPSDDAKFKVFLLLLLYCAISPSKTK